MQEFAALPSGLNFVLEVERHHQNERGGAYGIRRLHDRLAEAEGYWAP